MSESKTTEQAALPVVSGEHSQAGKQLSKAGARSRMVEKIRSELNIEKWPAIWQPAKSKNKPALRTMQREVRGGDGGRMVSRVEVGFTQLGTLTTEEQKLLYVLIKLWEDADKPDVQVFFSTRGLARMLRRKGWGTNVIESVTKSLRKLRTIPIEWINSYFDRAVNGGIVIDRRPFTILADLRIVEHRQDGAVNSSRGYFRFDDHILSNLLLNYTKPVCIEEFFKLRSEIAQLVYSHIDLMLSDKTKYERRTRELLEDLGLKNPEYNHMYERKRALEKAVRELQGIRLSSGTLRSGIIEKTKDGKDYKVSFQKARGVELATERLEAVAAEGHLGPVVVNHYSKQRDPLTAQAEEVVCRFHRVFHGVERHTPQSKETAQALSLISQHGFERARSIVDFAFEEAAKTGYRIQHFGAVLSYTSRALVVIDRKPVEPSENFRHSGERLKNDRQPDPQWELGERRLAYLTEAQRQTRSARIKIELERKHAFLGHHAAADSPLLQRMIRAQMIRELGTEPMEVMPLTCTPTWARHVAQNFGL